MKLPLPSNERSLIGKNYHTLATLLLPLINGSTVYNWSHTIKPTLFIWITHPWYIYIYMCVYIYIHIGQLVKYLFCFCLTLKCYTRLKIISRNKRSSLFWQFSSDKVKSPNQFNIFVKLDRFSALFENVFIYETH